MRRTAYRPIPKPVESPLWELDLVEELEVWVFGAGSPGWLKHRQSTPA